MKREEEQKLEMSKTEFAGHIGVVPSRITAMIAAGIIGPDALVGEGRHARIKVELATEQIRVRRNPSQSLGNGLGTRLDTATRAGAQLPSATGEDIPRQIQLERLEFERRRNRQASIEEKRSAGTLVLAEDMRREVARTITSVMAFYDALPIDLGNELAARFGVPSRDVVHAVRNLINTKRAAAADRFRREAEALPETTEVQL